jgi:hypothetical protein
MYWHCSYILFFFGFRTGVCMNTATDNKVLELATVCLPWQRWTKALVWFDELTYQRFTAVLFFIYGSLFLSGIYCCH